VWESVVGQKSSDAGTSEYRCAVCSLVCQFGALIRRIGQRIDDRTLSCFKKDVSEPQLWLWFFLVEWRLLNVFVIDLKMV